MLAYLDPASGSMIVQGLVAGAAGVAVVGKLGLRRLSSPLRRKKGTEGQYVETPTEVDVDTQTD